MASFLHPPNSHALSDLIIGDVMQRHHRADELDAAPTYPISGRAGALHVMADMVSSQKRRLPPISTVSKKRRVAVAAESPSETCKTPSNRRERCRVNQARYRDKQRRHMTELEQAIDALKEQVCKLEVQKQAIRSRAPTNETVWNVAAEYFRLFRHGYTMPAVTDDGDEKSEQTEFLQRTMAADVADGALQGAEAIVEHWRLLSTHFQDVHLHLQRLEQGPQGSLVATTTTSVIISDNTLRRVFPQLQAEGGAEWSELGQKLRSQRVVMKGSVRFHWDSVQGRVVRLESSTDMLTPMLRLLGSLDHVARVFDGAAITPECDYVRL